MMSTWNRMGAGWRLRIVHETGFSYDGEARASCNEARLTPPTLSRQNVLMSEVRIEPHAARWRYQDYWGNEVVTFQLDQPHRDLKVTAESIVETSEAKGHEGAMDWKALRSDNVTDLMNELLVPTQRTAPPVDLAALVASRIEGLSPHDAADAISEIVRETLTYTAGATGVQTSAAEATAVGRGVCQDFSHLALGLLRSVGIPARYVSGYLYPDISAEIGDSGLGESHAWVEYFAGEWTAIDPTNGSPVGPRHVVVARGRDYGDAAPLIGIYHGAPSTALGVVVHISRVA